MIIGEDRKLLENNQLINQQNNTLTASQNIFSHNHTPKLWIKHLPDNQNKFMNIFGSSKFQRFILFSLFVLMLYLFIIQSYQIRYLQNLQLWKKSTKQQFLKANQKFQIKVGNIGNNDIEITPYLTISKKKLGFDTRLQVGTNIDPEILQNIDYKQLQKDLLEEIKYQRIFLEKNNNSQTNKQLINITHFKNDNQIQKYLNNLHKVNIQNIQQNNKSNPKYNLAVSLIKNSVDPQALQAEYYYANKNYQIGKLDKQISICVFTNSYQIMTRDQYQQYFQSLGHINYTNFHVVYVDDNSPDHSALLIRDYLKLSNSRIANRITLIRNAEHMGALANMFFWIKKFCNQDDIVVSLDGDDALIGRQAFKIINSIYQDKNIWFSYSSNLIFDKFKNQFIMGTYSRSINEQISRYRSKFEWNISPVRTFRKKLFDSLPLYSVIEYHYDKNQGIVWPAFFSFASDVFVYLSLVQLAGIKRIRYLDDVLYQYIGPSVYTRDCYLQHEQYDNFRSRIKIPLKELKFLGEEAEKIDGYKPKNQNFVKLKLAYDILKQCQQYTYELLING